MDEMTLPCIVCGYQPESAFNGCTVNPLHKATAFNTQGHYGSTFFDPMDGSYLEINVCDECLTKAKTENKILRYAGRSNPTIYNGDNHE